MPRKTGNMYSSDKYQSVHELSINFESITLNSYNYTQECIEIMHTTVWGNIKIIIQCSQRKAKKKGKVLSTQNAFDIMFFVPVTFEQPY